MKTLKENQNWSAGLGAYIQNTEADPRPKIGDDDGISNRAMNFLIVLFTLLTVGVTVVAAATPNDDVKYRIVLRQAMLDIDRMDYDKAIVKLLEVRANTPENANVNYLLGKSYLYGEVSYEKAVFYLNRAATSVTDEYENWDLEETRAPNETVYLLAMAYENLEQFDLAAELYGIFLTELKNEGKLDESSKTYAIISRSAERSRIAAANQSSDEQVGIAQKAEDQ